MTRFLICNVSGVFWVALGYGLSSEIATLTGNLWIIAGVIVAEMQDGRKP